MEMQSQAYCGNTYALDDVVPSAGSHSRIRRSSPVYHLFFTRLSHCDRGEIPRHRPSPSRRLMMASFASSVLQRFKWIFSARSSMAAVAHTFAARGLVTLINVINGVLVARALAPAGRGEQTALILWPEVLCGLCTLGIPAALRYSIRRSVKDTAPLFTVALVYGVALGCVATAIGVAFIPLWLHGYSEGTVRFAQMLMIFAPAIMVGVVYQAFLEARADFRTSNFILYAGPCLTLMILIALLISRQATPRLTSLAYLLPTVVLTAFRAHSFRRFIVLRFAFLRFSKRLLSYGIPAFGIDVLRTLSTQVDQALVIRLLTASELGLYTVALSASRLLSIVQASLSTVLLPRASGLALEEALPLIGRAARLTFAITGCCAVLAAITFPFLIPRLYGAAFLPAVPIAQVLTAEVTIADLTYILAQAFLTSGRPGIVSILQGVGLAAALPLMLMLIPRFGLLGAALSLLASTILRLVFVMICYPLVLARKAPNLILCRRDILFLVSKF